MICRCCGKEFTVLYPDLWAYRVGKKWYCTWKCLRADEKGDKEMPRMKKDSPIRHHARLNSRSRPRSSLKATAMSLRVAEALTLRSTTTEPYVNLMVHPQPQTAIYSVLKNGITSTLKYVRSVQEQQPLPSRLISADGAEEALPSP